MTDSTPKYKRILLKLSGEALMGGDAYGINRQTIGEIVGEIKAVADMGSGAKASDPRFALAVTDLDLLFNLAQDPGENHDLAAAFPDRLESMRKQLSQIQAAKP